MPRKREGRTLELSRHIQKVFGANLAKARLAAPQPLLQQDLARRLNLSRTSVSNIECGTQGISLVQAYLAARAVGVDVRKLLPEMDQVFPTGAVSVAEDDPLGIEVEGIALKVVEKIERRLAAEAIRSREQRGRSK